MLCSYNILVVSFFGQTDSVSVSICYISQNAVCHTAITNMQFQCAPPSLGSLSRLGLCLDRSWQQKKLMAPGCEPASVRAMMEALRPLVLGQSLAGAGGGGFLYLLTREPRQRQAVLQVLANTAVSNDQ